MYRYLLTFILFLLVFSVDAQEKRPKTELFIKKYEQGKYQKCRKLCTKLLKEKIPLLQLKMMGSQLEKQFGKLEKTEFMTSSKMEDLYLSTYKVIHANGSYKLEISENEKGKIAGFFIKPLAYQMPPYAKNTVISKEKLFIKSDTLQLPAELIIPRSPEKCPLVILIHGSGANDMDESIGPNKVFYDLALGLAEQGIATLRYDKRTKVYDSLYSGQNFSLYDETIEDALEALELARQLQNIDTSRIYFAGHSLGAMVIPYLLVHSEVKGGVMLAGPSRSLADLIMDQTRFFLELDGKLSKKDQASIKEVESRYQKIKNKEFTEETPAKDLLGYWGGKYWNTESTYLPLNFIKSNRKPLLILQGARDYQVDPVKDFIPLKQVCDQVEGCESIEYEGLNHLFIVGKGDPNPSEYFLPGNVDEKVIRDISDWILQPTKR